MNLEINDGDEIATCTLDEFIAANETLDEDETGMLTSLEVGAEMSMGGGAAPIFTIRRIS